MTAYSVHSDSKNEASNDDSSDESDDEEEEMRADTDEPHMAKIILRFFWSSIEGDFTWPVASFPLHKINAKMLWHCV